MTKTNPNIASHLPAMARLDPDRLAIIAAEGKLTFGQLDAQSDVYARGLEAIGIGRGVRTVLMVPPSLDFFPLVFGLFKAGAVIVMNYGDGRSFTFTFNSANDNGVSRSDGRVTTKWIGAGYSSPVLTIDLAYGEFTPGSVTNVFDDYGLNFVTATTGSILLRENITSATFATTTPLAGTFTITTFPPGG